MMRYKLAALHSHPIQYFAPLYRRLAQDPTIDLTVYFCSRQGVDPYVDPGFQQRFSWDVPLLDGYKSNFLPNIWRKDRVHGFFSLMNPGIVTELRKGHYDALLVHGHNYATYLLALLSAKLLGIPTLMRCETHLLLRRSGIKARFRKPVMSFFYRRLCAACLPIGSRNKRFYQHLGVQDDRLFLVPYTVDNTFFLDAVAKSAGQRHIMRSDLGIPTDKPIILFASKLIERKRPFDLLLAYQALRESCSNATLMFIGSGSEEASLKAYVKDQRIPDVYFMGFRNQTELPSFFAMSDIFVLPSEDEPWGLVINEVMCAGLPVITTREVGAAADLVKPGYNGFVFTTGDIAQLCDELHKLCTNDSLRKEMGEHSHSLIEPWNLDACVRGVKEALRFVSNHKHA